MADTKEPIVATVKEKKPPPPDPNAYPKWRYHASLPAVVVQDKADEESRTPSSDGWSDTVAEPAKPPAPPPPAVKKPTPPAPTK